MSWSCAVKKRAISRLSEVSLRPRPAHLLPLNLILSVGGIWGKFAFLNLTGRIFTANLSGNFQSWVRLGVKFDELRGSVAAPRG
ncbi:hypothetical protein [uncultured Campylobacter sp.]|uniref:hypothetical protein n=1 Tax=uncultured Campylobacter sp. TaxID=218934 RepID=UPI0028EEFE3E|nr:hypothetical protein [uncultured Campylobacter sp.]